MSEYLTLGNFLLQLNLFKLYRQGPNRIVRIMRKYFGCREMEVLDTYELNEDSNYPVTN